MEDNCHSYTVCMALLDAYVELLFVKDYMKTKLYVCIELFTNLNE